MPTRSATSRRVIWASPTSRATAQAASRISARVASRRWQSYRASLCLTPFHLSTEQPSCPYPTEQGCPLGGGEQREERHSASGVFEEVPGGRRMTSMWAPSTARLRGAAGGRTGWHRSVARAAEATAYRPIDVRLCARWLRCRPTVSSCALVHLPAAVRLGAGSADSAPDKDKADSVGPARRRPSRAPRPQPHGASGQEVGPAGLVWTTPTTARAPRTGAPTVRLRVGEWGMGIDAPREQAPGVSAGPAGAHRRQHGPRGTRAAVVVLVLLLVLLVGGPRLALWFGAPLAAKDCVSQPGAAPSR